MRSPRSMCRLTSSRTTLAPYALRPCLNLEHGAAALGGGGELKADALALGRHVDALDLLEHLDAALHLRRLRRLIAEAADECLDALNLLVLAALGLAQPLEPRVALDQVLRVVAVVVGDRLERQVGDARHDRVEEVAVVGHDDDGVRDSRPGSPRASCARRGRGDWSARRAAAGRARSSSSLASASRICHPPERCSAMSPKVSGSKPSPASTDADLEVHLVPVGDAKLVLQLGVAMEDGLVLRLGLRRVGQPLLESRASPPSCRAAASAPAALRRESFARDG